MKRIYHKMLLKICKILGNITLSLQNKLLDLGIEILQDNNKKLKKLSMESRSDLPLMDDKKKYQVLYQPTPMNETRLNQCNELGFELIKIVEWNNHYVYTFKNMLQ